MENLLANLVKERRQEELAKLNAIQIVDSLFGDLMDRERDILTRRFGLDGDKNQTLEKIGQIHKLTRERVRQIENASIKKIKRLDNLGEYLNTLKGVVGDLLREHGGMLKRDMLLEILTVMALDLNNESNPESGDYERNRQVYKKRFDFLLGKMLSEDFELLPDSEHFNAAVKLKDGDLQHFHDLAEELLSKLDDAQETMGTDDIFSFLKDSDSYKRHQEKVTSDGVDISSIFEHDIFPDKADLINSNKALYSLIQTAKKVDQNKFGHWGKADWHEIKPKTINDKIYLVLKNYGEPLHFTDIAQKINEIKFDKKKANPATVHNELILDDRYILTGRGMYGLREWQNK